MQMEVSVALEASISPISAATSGETEWLLAYSSRSTVLPTSALHSLRTSTASNLRCLSTVSDASLASFDARRWHRSSSPVAPDLPHAIREVRGMGMTRDWRELGAS